jgi:hypothetical protein
MLRFVALLKNSIVILSLTFTFIVGLKVILISSGSICDILIFGTTFKFFTAYACKVYAGTNFSTVSLLLFTDIEFTPGEASLFAKFCEQVVSYVRPAYMLPDTFNRNKCRETAFISRCDDMAVPVPTTVVLQEILLRIPTVANTGFVNAMSI